MNIEIRKQICEQNWDEMSRNESECFQLMCVANTGKAPEFAAAGAMPQAPFVTPSC
jgi:hypothetical protein